MEAQELITAYRTGFYVCAALAILGLILSVSLFFRFNIPNLWAVRTGRAEQRAVQELQAKGKQEGQMRKSPQRHLSGQEEFSEKMKKTDALLAPPATSTSVLPQNQEPFGTTGDLGYGVTKDLQPAAQGEDSAFFTTVLDKASPATTVLAQEEQLYGSTDDLGFGATAALGKKQSVPPDGFVITQEEIAICTEEKIPDGI